MSYSDEKVLYLVGQSHTSLHDDIAIGLQCLYIPVSFANPCGVDFVAVDPWSSFRLLPTSDVGW